MGDEKTPNEQPAVQDARIVKAKANGFAQGKSIAPVKRTTTERYEAAMEDDLELILRKVKRAWIRGLDSENVKIAVDTAHKISGHLYRPDTKVKVEHTGNTGGNTYNVVQVDSLSPEERALLERAKAVVPIETDVIEGELVEVEVDEGS